MGGYVSGAKTRFRGMVTFHIRRRRTLAAAHDGRRLERSLGWRARADGPGGNDVGARNEIEPAAYGMPSWRGGIESPTFNEFSKHEGLEIPSKGAYAFFRVSEGRQVDHGSTQRTSLACISLFRAVYQDGSKTGLAVIFTRSSRRFSVTTGAGASGRRGMLGSTSSQFIRQSVAPIGLVYVGCLVLDLCFGR